MISRWLILAFIAVAMLLLVLPFVATIRPRDEVLLRILLLLLLALVALALLALPAFFAGPLTVGDLPFTLAGRG